ncbi:MAG TPA: exodeoxyribonuclease III [Polyangiaceae bacterium]|jgi:exodeoxyribonuclease-3|nr:exodeoxyribonuclease III [Polyangiaceae bacterium]
MRVATWNVNSLRARLDLVTAWLKHVEPDVLCMQETKVEDKDFPTEEFERLGYGVAKAGQKSYNGVAIASRLPLHDVRIGLLAAQPDDHKRVISAVVDDLRVCCVYAPNGKAVGTPYFEQKLDWFHQLRRLLDSWQEPKNGLVVCGDYNVAPEARDVFDVEKMRGQLHFHPAEHAALKHLMEYGLVDLFRLHQPAAGLYSWWDYRAGSFRRNMGLRIDYMLGSKAAADHCTQVKIDKEERAKERPSDHCPVIATFE